MDTLVTTLSEESADKSAPEEVLHLLWLEGAVWQAGRASIGKGMVGKVRMELLFPSPEPLHLCPQNTGAVASIVPLDFPSFSFSSLAAPSAIDRSVARL